MMAWRRGLAVALGACAVGCGAAEEPDGAAEAADSTSEASSAFAEKAHVLPCLGVTGPCFNSPPVDLSAAALAGGRESVGRSAPAIQRVASPSRWVGLILTGPATCPAPRTDAAADGAWSVERPYPAARGYDLDRICLYSWQSATGATPRENLLPDSSRLRLQVDVAANVALATPPREARDLLADAYYDQLGFPDVWPGAPDTGASRERAPVTVAVLDSVDHDLGVRDDVSGVDTQVASLSGHSALVGSVINGLVCPRERFFTEDPSLASHCSARLVNYLALPMIGADLEAPPPAAEAPFISYPKESGGYFGRQSDVATALYRAVQDWKQDATPSGRKLVINLSVGWEAQYGGAAIENLRIPAWSAQKAVRYAHCEGALLIAAAGNKGRNVSSGVMYPAGWETLVPSCPAGTPGAAAALADFAPMVHAVGGVDGRDEPLGVTRPASQPRLVAPGAVVAVPHVGLRDAGGLLSTVAATGTSLSAAAAAGVAAVVWSLQPTLRPWQVMELVYRGGQDLGMRREVGYCAPKVSNCLGMNQRRLSFCGAVREACAAPGAVGCPAAEVMQLVQDGCRGAEPVEPDLARAAELTYPGLATVRPSRPILSTPVVEQVAELGPTEQPSAFPQPNSVNCGVCRVEGNAQVRTWTAYGEVDEPSATPAGVPTFQSGSLVVTWTSPAAGVSPVTVRYNASAALLSYQPFALQLTAPLGYTYPKQATLELTATKGSTWYTAASEIETVVKP